MSKKWVGSRIFLGTVCGVLGACGAPSIDGPVEPPPPPHKAIAMQVTVLHGGRAAPTMSFVAAKQPVVSDAPEQVAWATLRGIKDGHKLGDQAIESAKLREIHDAGNGPLIARFEQEVDGVPVFLRTLNIAMDRNLQPTLASGQLAGKLRKVSDRFQLDESVAVESALRAMSGERGSAQSMGAAIPAGGGYSNRQLVAQLSAAEQTERFVGRKAVAGAFADGQNHVADLHSRAIGGRAGDDNADGVRTARLLPIKADAETDIRIHLAGVGGET